MIPLTEEEEKLFNETTATCHICKEHIVNVEDKVRDHCHILGVSEKILCFRSITHTLARAHTNTYVHLRSQLIDSLL